MQAINWEAITEHMIVDGLYGKFFHSETMTVVRWRFEEGADLPVHNHPHEQITMVQEGSLELALGEKIINLVTGDVLPISSGTDHGGKAITATIALDIFHPVRQDFKEKYG